MFSKEIFAERIKILRLKMNISQSELGKIVGLTYTAISDIERGRRTTTIEKLDALADCFGVSADYLMGRTNNSGFSK